MHDVVYEVLDHVYNHEFKRSADFKRLYEQIHDNMIEYRFLNMAGITDHMNKKM